MRQVFSFQRYSFPGMGTPNIEKQVSHIVCPHSRTCSGLLCRQRHSRVDLIAEKKDSLRCRKSARIAADF